MADTEEDVASSESKDPAKELVEFGNTEVGIRIVEHPDKLTVLGGSLGQKGIELAGSWIGHFEDVHSGTELGIETEVGHCKDRGSVMEYDFLPCLYDPFCLKHR